MKQFINMKSNEYCALDKYALVKVDEQSTEEITNSGIVVSTRRSVLDRPCYGTVVAIAKNEKGVEKGDMVVWPNTDGIDAEFLDGDFLILKLDSIIGKKIPQ